MQKIAQSGHTGHKGQRSHGIRIPSSPIFIFYFLVNVVCTELKKNRLTCCLSGLDSTKEVNLLGGIPGLEVNGRDSCSKGCGFESQHQILDGHFSYLFVVKIVMFVCKDENKRKRSRGLSIFKKQANLLLIQHKHIS